MPKPVLQAMVLADNVYQDRTTGKFIIAGTFSRLGITRRLTPPVAPPTAPPTGTKPGSYPPAAPASLLENPPPMYASAVPMGAPQPASPAPQAPPPPATPPGAPPAETTTFRSAAELTRAVSTSGSPHLYVALTDVHRSIPLKVRFVDLSDISETVSRFEIGLEVNSPDPLAVVELVVPMPWLPVTGAGTFSLDLLYADEILGSWRIVVTEETLPG